MDVISSGYLKEESFSLATYTIIIKNFRGKLARTPAGDGDESKGYLSLFLFNRNDWMVYCGHLQPPDVEGVLPVPDLNGL